MGYVILTIVLTIAYVVVAFVVGLFAVIVLRPIATLIGHAISAPAARERKMAPEQAALFKFTGMNFVLMIMMFAFYAGLAWVITTHFVIWPWPIYVVAVLLSLNYWVNVAGKLPSYEG